MDSLSLLFLFLILLGAIPNLFYSFGYLSHIKRKLFYNIHYFAFIISMIGVVLAKNALEFLFFWELMSLTSWQLILTEIEKDTLKSARFYFFMTHFGFVFILLFFLIASNGDLSLDFASMHQNIQNFPYKTFLFFLLVFGFLSKAGVVPFHVWLPYAHPAAPSPVSAMMSGVMLKVALYGFFRMLFDVLYPWQMEWGVLVLVLGALSSVIGVLYALSEHDIKALLANHSIENIGIILIGFGMGMIFYSLNLKTLAAFSFIAALFHTFNHMSFKSLLFMSAGSVLYATHTRNMEKYGGLIKTMPITAFSFLLAAISISALPPTNGFLSEWMIFQSLLSSSNISDLLLRLSIPFAIFSLAITGGLAIACFVKAFGISFLGLSRDENVKYAKEVNSLMKIGMILMGVVVISLMLFAPFFVKLFDRAIFEFSNISIYDKIFPTIFEMHSVSNGGVVAPLFLLFGLILITLMLYLYFKFANIKTRIYPSWACGYKTNPKTQYSATGFAGPIRRFFSWLYKPKEHIAIENIAGHKTKFKYFTYEVHVKPLFEESLYDSVKKLVYKISYYVYRLAHFEKVRYPAMIFNLLLIVLFSYRIFTHQFSWATFLFEIAISAISIKILLIGDKK